MSQAKVNSGYGLYVRWVAANALAEGVGLGGSLLVGAALFLTMQSSPGVWIELGMALLAVLLGTLFEGVVVGLAQGWVLRRPLPALRWRSWVIATAAGAGVAWLLAMTFSTAMSLAADTAAQPVSAAPPPEVNDALMIALVAPAGLALGTILGLPQWIILRRHVSKAGWWVLANALAWMCGLPLTFIGPSAISPTGLTVFSVAAILVTVVAAGAVVGAIHGAALVWLLRTHQPAGSE